MDPAGWVPLLTVELGPGVCVGLRLWDARLVPMARWADICVPVSLVPGGPEDQSQRAQLQSGRPRWTQAALSSSAMVSSAPDLWGLCGRRLGVWSLGLTQLLSVRTRGPSLTLAPGLGRGPVRVLLSVVSLVTASLQC
ncbi:hypothetical protein GW7_16978 [Heterocephalus glaber]|uniref:Uncharacterized protein n=1 Tax=Heterocephalus glaber TaxID=10181 RepID=G5BF80_HETGA|nr:hypothetical protein GW7_16978 [Heterocephalus glaber]